LEVLGRLPWVFGAWTVVVDFQCIVIEFGEVSLPFLCCDPPKIQQSPQDFPVATSRADRQSPGCEWMEVSFPQVTIVISEVDDRVAIHFGNGRVC